MIELVYVKHSYVFRISHLPEQLTPEFLKKNSWDERNVEQIVESCFLASANPSKYPINPSDQKKKQMILRWSKKINFLTLSFWKMAPIVVHLNLLRKHSFFFCTNEM